MLEVTPRNINKELLYPKFYEILSSAEEDISLGFLRDIGKTIALLPHDEEFNKKFVSKIEPLLQRYSTENNWRYIFYLLSGFCNVEYLFEINELFFQTMYTVSTIYILDGNLQIATQAVRLLSIVLKYSRKCEKEDILRFIDKNLFDNESFYRRRVHPLFIEACSNHFSIQFMKENGIIDHFISTLSGNSIIACKGIALMAKIYPLIADDNRLRFMVMNKLEQLRKEGTDLELKIVIHTITHRLSNISTLGILSTEVIQISTNLFWLKIR